MTTTTPGAPGIHSDHSGHLAHLLEHWGHLLPSQGPMSTFVHHNTLHGLQHQPFEEAVIEGERLLGGGAYESADRGRARYRAGRITDEDLDAVFAARGLDRVEVLATVGGRTVSDNEIRRLHFLFGVNALPAAVLRHALRSEGAGWRLAADVGEAARHRFLSRAQRELAACSERVGYDWTLADWVGALLNLDAPGAVLAQVRGRLTTDKAVTAGPSLSRLLRRLAIPPNRWEGYLAAVDAHCERLSATDTANDVKRRLWLLAEARIVRGLAHRHFGEQGTFTALEAHFASDLEGYAVSTLWQACLAAFGISDPLATAGPVTAGARSPSSSPEEILEAYTIIERHGGLAVPLTPEVRSAVIAVAVDTLDHLRSRADENPAIVDNPAHREVAYAAWFVLDNGEPAGLSRLAADAFYHLVRNASGSTFADREDLADQVAARDPRRALVSHVGGIVADLLDGVGSERSHAELVQALTGEDIVERVNRYMIRRCAAFLDLGQGAWRMPDRPFGFYQAWRRSAPHDSALDLEGIPGWREEVAALPERSEDAATALLVRLGVERDQWEGYVGRVLTGLPGWAGAMNWRGTHPRFPRQQAQPTNLAEYLAVRLFVEEQFVADVTRRVWAVEPAEVVAHLRVRPLEVWLRREAIRGALPSDLTHAIRRIAAGATDASWVILADQEWARRVGGDSTASFLAHDHAWRLFRIAQLQGWAAGDVGALAETVRDRLLSVFDAFPESAHRPVWLAAFERHYREEILSALAANRGRGRWRERPIRPKAQVVFCIDEREESIHRAFDELDSGYETFGAGGFFGIAMDYRGLDDHADTPLCPANVTPANRVEEIPRPKAAVVGERRAARRRAEEVVHNAYWETKRNAVSAFFLTQLTGLVQALPLAGRVLMPWRWTNLAEATRRTLVPRPATALTLDADDSGRGFELSQQVDRVEAQLRNIGMTHHFARLVVFCGHGSVSVNNPHESAHDCGACGGKHGGANGRAFAALANSPSVREELRLRGIDIPHDTHFVGAIHNTASDQMVYYDTEDIPSHHMEEWAALRGDLDKASSRSARERCRRFASAPRYPSPAAALRHVQGRSRDLSQVRPEWGHCTNAFAVVGRRSLTQGAFFDRRGFVISYDPTQDPAGEIIERILLAMGPVGAGINLEYYFSSVDNQVWGCDTKVPHNVSGLLGVMEGAASDLRTGLPQQMIEIHEPMRLLLVVEATLDVLGGIYGRQPAIAELLDNEWVQLVAMDPDSGAFHRFVAGVGFVPWEDRIPPLEVVASSHDYYRGKQGFLPPVLIETAILSQAKVER